MMTLEQIRRMACECAGPEYHQTGNARCAISILLASSSQTVEEATSQLYASEQRYAEAWELGNRHDIGRAAEELLCHRNALIAAVRAESLASSSGQGHQDDGRSGEPKKITEENNDHGAAAAQAIPEYAEIRAASEIEQKYRRELWLNHGHTGAALYGDDGEMQCSACMVLSRLYDYKRAPLADVESAAFMARTRRVAEALACNQAATSGIASPAASPALKTSLRSGEPETRRAEMTEPRPILTTCTALGSALDVHLFDGAVCRCGKARAGLMEGR